MNSKTIIFACNIWKETQANKKNVDSTQQIQIFIHITWNIFIGIDFSRGIQITLKLVKSFDGKTYSQLNDNATETWKFDYAKFIARLVVMFNSKNCYSSIFHCAKLVASSCSFHQALLTLKTWHELHWEFSRVSFSDIDLSIEFSRKLCLKLDFNVRKCDWFNANFITFITSWFHFRIEMAALLSNILSDVFYTNIQFAYVKLTLKLLWFLLLYWHLADN